MAQEQKPRERSFIRALVPDWRLTREQKLWAVRIVLALVVLLGILTLVGLPFDVTLWDWLDLLIIPIVLALGGYLFTRSENQRNREIADERRQDDTLQAYVDGMSQLLTDKERPLHRAQQGDGLSTVARARTLTVLPRLNGGRKGSVVQFLYESGLLTRDHPIVNLERSNLSGADLIGADLSGAYLSAANLHGLRAYLHRAYLHRAYLSGTDLREANLSETDLHGATGITNEELEQQASILDSATMPNGQKYEEWLKSKGRGEDE